MDNKILIAAHRGFMGGYIPCNTMKAFQAAIAQGADIIELDALRSADGTMWIFHEGNEFAHLGRDIDLHQLHDEEISKLTYISGDRVNTLNPIMRLDEALDYLKTRALINVDKSWLCLKETVETIKRCGAEESVILKSPEKREYVEEIEELAPKMKFMPIIKSPAFLEYVRSKKVQLYGAEILFETEDNIFCKDEFIADMHKRGEKIWVNAIEFNYHDVLSAYHNDTTAFTISRDYGWGWLRDKGYDIIQTDFPESLRFYLEGKIR